MYTIMKVRQYENGQFGTVFFLHVYGSDPEFVWMDCFAEGWASGEIR